MEKQQKYVLTPIAGAVAAALSPAPQAIAQDNSAALEEIVVTATKRSVGVQDIPASIQAITQDSLEAMGAKSMEDYSRFIPAVNVISYGASSNTVVFRGAITSAGYIAASTSSVYLDEISLTTTGSQPQIRMVDIERVEALSGPQGTIYGSDAQAGTLRIVTNKPVLNDFGAAVDLEVRGGDKSDGSYRGSLVFNFPLVDDRLAMRVVGYNDQDGGFIDNVFGHTPDQSTTGVDYPSGFGTLDNSASVESRWNDSEVTGGRLSLLWQLNDSWSMDLVAVGQSTESGADNDFDPFVGDLKTTRFHDEYSIDDYEMYSFVLKGDLGFAELVAAANYYERDSEYLSDITVYAHYWTGLYCYDNSYLGAYDPDRPDYYVNYYLWVNPETGFTVYNPSYCSGATVSSDFFASYYEPYQQDKTTFELRLSHQGDTIDWIVGYYTEESNDNWQAPFADPTTGGDGLTNLYQDSVSLDYMEWFFTTYYYDDGNVYTYPEATSWWYAESETEWSQDALFGEMTWHISDKVDLTVGGRYFDRSNVNFYGVDHPGDIGNNGEPDTADPDSRAFRLANDGHPPPHADTETEFIPKVALAYTTDNDNMIYGLYTQGTRPGGVNRSRGQPFFPESYTSDLMDNYEMGWRSTYANGQGRFNATAYHMVWTDYQLELTDPSSSACPDDGPGEIPNVCGQPWQNIVTNAGKAHITGLNLELDYAFNENWIFGANVMFMEAETDTSADLTGDGELDLVAGLRLPLSPEAKGAAWLDYVTPTQWLGSEETFMRLQVSHTGDSVNKLDPDGEDTANPQLSNPAYTIADFRVGIRGSTWELSAFVNNITDERAVYTYGTGQMNWSASSVEDGRDHFLKQYTNRPREFGIRFAKAWGDGM